MLNKLQLEFYYLRLFSKYENLDAMQWMVKTFGVENFNLESLDLVDDFKVLKDKIGEDEVVDFYISSGIIPYSLQSKETHYNQRNNVNILINLNKSLTKKSKEKLIPFLDFTDEHKGFDILYLLAHYVVVEKMPEAIKILKLSESDIIKVADHVATLTNTQYDNYDSTIKELIINYPTFTKTLLNYNNLQFNEKLLNLIPGVKEIFMW